MIDRIEHVTVQGNRWAPVTEAKRFADHYGIRFVDALELLSVNDLEEANRKAAEMVAARAAEENNK